MALKIKITAKDLASKTLRGTAGAVKRVGKAAKGAAKSMAKLGVGFGVIGGAIGVLAIKKAGDFQKGLFEIGTLMGDLNGTEIPQMHDNLMKLAGSTGQALDKLTKANYDAVSAGFTDINDSMEMLNVASKLAVGGVSDVGTSMDLLTTALNSYGKDANDAMETSDKLFTIVRLGKTTINEIAGSFGKMAAIAAPAGVSIDELGAAMAVLTARGQSTEEATTAVRAAIVELSKPGKELAEALDSVGISSGEALLKQEGLEGALKKVKEAAIKNNTSIGQLLSNIRSMQAVLPLAGDGAVDFKKALEDMEGSAGATNTAFELMEKTWSQTWNKFKAHIGNIMIEIGDVIIEKLQPKMDAVNKELERIGDIGWTKVASTVWDNMDMLWDGVVKITKVWLAMLPKIVKATFTLLGKLAVESIKMGVELMDLDWKDLLFPESGKESALKLAKVWGKDIAKDIVNAEEYAELPDVLQGAFATASAVAKKDGQGAGQAWLYGYFKDSGLTGKMNTNFQQIWKELEKDGGNVPRILAAQWEHVFGGFKFTEEMDLDAETSKMNQSFVASFLDAAKESKQITEELYNKLITLAAESDTQPDLTPKTGGGGKKKKKGAEKKTVTPVDKAVKVPAPDLSLWQWGVDQMDGSWAEMWEGLITKNEDGETQFGETIQKMAGAFGQVAKTVVGVGDAMLNHRLGNIEEERKTEYAKLDSMGLGAEEYAKRKELIDKKMDVKAKAAKEKHKKWAIAEVLINGALAIVKGYSQLGPVLGTVAAIMIAATAAIQIATINAQTFAQGGLVKRFAEGGSTGYGTDTVPAMLTPGEYVIKKSSVDKYGTGFFDQLNKFQEGGSVGAGVSSSNTESSKVINVNIKAVDAKSFYEWVATDPEGLSRAIQIIDERGFIDVDSSTGAITSQFGTGGL